MSLKQKNYAPQGRLALLSAAICMLGFSAPTSAQDTAPPKQVTAAPDQEDLVNIMPAKSIKDSGITIDETTHTHPPVRLTPDKSEIIKLDRKAASIIIGNPNHLSIMADSSTRLVLVPRAPGASFFTILDGNGDVIMQRHAIVASPKKEYVRIRNTCSADNADSCQQTSVFYCPDMCHEIMIGSGESGNGGGAASAAADSASKMADDSNDSPEEGSE